MSNLVHVRHTVSGVIADVPQHIYDHEILGAYLELVDEDAKPLLPEMHVPRQADKETLVFEGADHSDEAPIVGYIDISNDKDED